MKRTVLAIFLLLALAGVGLSAEFAPLVPAFSTMGTAYDNTFKSTLDNTAKSLRTLAEAAGISWFVDGRPPQGMIVSVETYDARMGTGNVSAANSIGHVLAVGSAARYTGEAYLSNLYFINKTAADNSVIQITLER